MTEITRNQVLPPYDIEVIYHDRDIAVIVKPGGLLAVPGRGPEKQDCAAARLRQSFPEMLPQPAVHRLDMFTSGLMVFAMTAEAHSRLSLQFNNREVMKKYVAVLAKDIVGEHGNSGEIRLAFRLDPDNRPYQVYDPDQGKVGITRWQRLGGDGKSCTVEFTPLTGRTHQLLLHAAHRLGLNAAIIGDSLYGSGQDGDRMFLHASHLSFLHPATKELLSFTSKPHFPIHSQQ